MNMNPKMQRILAHLQSDPRWHYGLDIAGATEVSRSSIYIHLAALEQLGYVERTRETLVCAPGAMPRPMYRARPTAGRAER